MANTNCLKDIRCPKCGSEGPFKIRATKVGMALVTDNGIEEHEGDTEWFDNSKCVCMACGEDAELRHFKDSDERQMIDRAFDSVSKEDSLLITKIAVRAKDVCRIRTLEQIESKPKKLTTKIAEIKDDIKKLVEYVDGR